MRKWLIFLLLFVAFPAIASTNASLRESASLYKNKKYGQALTKYNEILKEQPKQEDASFGAGAASYQLKDYATAQKHFDQVAKSSEKLQQDALFNLGNTYYKAEQKEKAIETYKKAILKNPNDKEAIHNLQIILASESSKNQQNDQNKDNNSDKSSQSQSGQNNNSASAQNEQTNNHDKEMAERVMQMAKENEGKRQTSSGEPQSNLVEKDW